MLIVKGLHYESSTPSRTWSCYVSTLVGCAGESPTVIVTESLTSLGPGPLGSVPQGSLSLGSLRTRSVCGRECHRGGPGDPLGGKKGKTGTQRRRRGVPGPSTVPQQTSNSLRFLSVDWKPSMGLFVVGDSSD